MSSIPTDHPLKKKPTHKPNKTHTIPPPQISEQMRTKLSLIKPNPQKICPLVPLFPQCYQSNAHKKQRFLFSLKYEFCIQRAFRIMALNPHQKHYKTSSTRRETGFPQLSPGAQLPDLRRLWSSMSNRNVLQNSLWNLSFPHVC